MESSCKTYTNGLDMCWAARYSHTSAKTLHVREIEVLVYAFCRFFKIENKDTNTQSMMTTEETKAAKLKQHLMQYKDGQCEVEIPWKRNSECLPENYDMVVKIMMNTPRLLKVISTKIMSRF